MTHYTLQDIIKITEADLKGKQTDVVQQLAVVMLCSERKKKVWDVWMRKWLGQHRLSIVEREQVSV